VVKKSVLDNVPAVTEVFFAPDKEKCFAFLRVQKKCGGTKKHKGRSPYMARPAVVFRRPSCRKVLKIAAQAASRRLQTC
jgi:hypothetical protein